RRLSADSMVRTNFSTIGPPDSDPGPVPFMPRTLVAYCEVMLGNPGYGIAGAPVKAPLRDLARHGQRFDFFDSDSHAPHAGAATEPPGYGARGVVGMLMPPANPTVEPEMAVLLGPDVAVLAARLASRFRSDPERVADYLESLDAAIDAFDTAPLQVAALGITGSTYLVGSERETEILQR